MQYVVFSSCSLVLLLWRICQKIILIKMSRRFSAWLEGQVYELDANISVSITLENIKFMTVC
jgi:hypothetical protein